jgi:MIP family channel proteins
VDRTWGEQLVAEFIGTFALVFIGAGSVVLASPAGTGVLGVALAHGLVLAVMVSVLGHISGAHFNPAVTVALFVVRKIDGWRTLLFIGTQLVAGIAAALALRGVLPSVLWQPSGGEASIGNTTVNEAFGMTTTTAVLLEAVLTFFLVIAVFGTAVDDRGAFGKTAGLTIGFVLTFDILVGGQLTGASMNPARTLGPAVATARFDDWWVYVAGPLAGGTIAASLYWWGFLRGRRGPLSAPPSEVPVESTDDEGTFSDIP